MLRLCSMFIIVATMAGCSMAPTKDPSVVVGPKATLKMDSKMLLDGRTFLTGAREVEVEVYDSSEGCVFEQSYPKSTTAYLFTTKLNFNMPANNVEIPAGDVIYVRLYDSIGVASQCVQAVSFKPEQGKDYYLDIKIQGDRTKICDAAVYQVSGNDKVLDHSFKWGGPKTIFKGIYDLTTSCQK